jgi:hypothetical protein
MRPGDCDGNGQVDINEIVTGIGIANRPRRRVSLPRFRHRRQQHGDDQ